jgi:hypothetical protein
MKYWRNIYPTIRNNAMAEQHDTFKDVNKQIEIAKKYTRGDIVKARDMLSGQYQDIMVVKGKFLVEEKGLSGFFLAYFNYIQEYIANVTAIISSKTVLFEKTRIFDSWKTLYNDLASFRESSDIIESQNFTYFLIDSFVGYDVFPDVQEHNLDDLTKIMIEIISKSFNAKSVKCQIEFEPTNSLALDTAGIKIAVPGAENLDIKDIVEEDDRVKKIESEAKFIIEGKAIIAPIQGKNANDLVPGDKIKVILPGKDLVSEKILRLLNAYDDRGERIPITGRIKANIPVEKTGYIIYAFVAKGVLAKIYEEENVKIMIEQPIDEFKSPPLFDFRTIIILAIAALLIILFGIILFQIM